MAMFSLTRFWPMYSESVLGRTLASRRASSSRAAPERMREGRSGSREESEERAFLGEKLGMTDQHNSNRVAGGQRSGQRDRLTVCGSEGRKPQEGAGDRKKAGW